MFLEHSKPGTSIITRYSTAKNELNSEFYIETPLINFILSGTKTIKSTDINITVQTGELIFIRNGRYIMSQLAPSNKGTYSAVLFLLTKDFLREFTRENMELFGHIENDEKYYHGKIPPLLNSSIDSLLPYFTQKTKSTPASLKYKIYEILLNIIESDKRNHFKKLLLSIANEDSDNLSYYMEKNFYLPYTVDTFAKNSFRSLSTFKKEFKELFNTTPKYWINNKRLEKAHLLLHTSNQSVTEISYLCGFESLSHFIQLFKQKYGNTPKQIQNQNR
jgi:AraC family transcriptional regulator, exoenzyme S synthesis regulatory protein ExsA